MRAAASELAVTFAAIGIQASENTDGSGMKPGSLNLARSRAPANSCAALVRFGEGIRVDVSPSETLGGQTGEDWVNIRLLRGLIDGLDLAAGRGAMAHEGILGRCAVGLASGCGPGGSGGRVVVSPSISCGKCSACRGGLSAHCASQRLLGLGGTPGCFAERFAAPRANLCAVPKEVDDDAAAFAVLAAAALHAAQRAAVHRDAMVTVLGDGRLGLILAQVLRPRVERVRVVGRYSEKLSLAERWGVKHRHVDDIGLRNDQDVVFECTGSRAGLGLALQMVRPRGTIVLKTLAAASAPVDAAEMDLAVRQEITIIGDGIVAGHGLVQEALAMIRRREIDVVSLISRRMSLRDGVAAIRQAESPGALGVLLMP